MGSKTLGYCIACGNTDLVPVLNLGNQPLANDFKTGVMECTTYPLELNFCRKCTHTQLSEAVDPEVLYKDYCYVSGTTQTLKQHFQDLAESAAAHFGRKAYGGATTPSILDIGCNDGSLLDQFKKAGFPHLYGVDPAENICNIAKTKGHQIYNDFWDADSGFRMVGLFDCITALNCLAHNSDPYGFLLGCRRVLADDGMIIIEFPYFKSTLETLDFGQIYAEHHSYFTAKSFVLLVERLGMHVAGVKFFPYIHGGTIRFTVMHGNRSHCNEVRTLVRSEKSIEVELEEFRTRLDSLTKALAASIFLYSETKKVVAYGASAKSSTLFNLPKMQIVTRKISYVVDDAPLKQGKFCPGSRLEVFPTTQLLEEDPKSLVILLTVHNFKREIVARLKEMGLGEAQLLSYTPHMTIERIDQI
jgi:2-polyprenyl-3-methyl-5-hydroxy-6-metoxy-1,4-benzoquinol methylase